MRNLVECVPNFSEGRRIEVVDELVAAVEDTRGVFLLDRTSDADHNRSVLTFAGPVNATAAAIERATSVAIDRIDLRRHSGEHPRIGAVDVVPFVPLGDTTMVECVALAQAVGQRLARRFDLPVFLYADAATRPERRILANIRRPRFEGLATAMQDPAWAPDFGPSRPHPSAGATVVGARPFLIAWNIDLASPDVELAKRIARSIRERDGGLPRVQALGLFLKERGCAQVSMNLLDFRTTPMWQVWESVADLAFELGVDVRESELIGLAPVAAFIDVADHAGVSRARPVGERIRAAAQAIRIRNFDPTMALELRLERAASAAP